MLLLLAIGIGTLAGCGTWLLLRARTFDLVLGLTLLSYAVNLFIFAMGRVKVNAVPIVKELQPGAMHTLANTADPLPQALVLTAIVISFAMTALLLGLALRTRHETGSDHVDGRSDRLDDARSDGRHNGRHEGHNGGGIHSRIDAPERAP